MAGSGENGPFGPPAKETRSGRLGVKRPLADVDDSRVDEATVDLTQRTLQAAYAEYRSAMAVWRAVSRSDARPASEAADERLLAARVGLYRALVDSGWTPPPGLTAQLERDAALLEAPEDFDALLGV